jgi:hypothetical protein
MQNGKISGWVTIAGFAVLAVGLGLEGVALYATYDNPGLAHSSHDWRSIERSEPMVRLLFDRND